MLLAADFGAGPEEAGRTAGRRYFFLLLSPRRMAKGLSDEDSDHDSSCVPRASVWFKRGVLS